MIQYSIEAALAAGCFDRIIVSTDDDEIKKVSIHAGAEVPFDRPAELSGDQVTVLTSIPHALEWLISHGAVPTHVCMLYATAPFVTGEVLHRSLDRLMAHREKSYCLAMTEFGYPIQRALYLTDDGGIKMFQPEHFVSRSQDLVKAFHDAGQFLWGTAEAFMTEAPVFESHTLPFVLPSHLVQDIDTESDWQRAELMYQTLMTQLAHAKIKVNTCQ